RRAMSRTHRYLSGLAGNYVNQAVVLVVGLWLTWFLLQRLPQEEYGLWLIVLQILAFLELTDLGVVAVLPRAVALRGGAAPDRQGQGGGGERAAGHRRAGGGVADPAGPGGRGAPVGALARSGPRPPRHAPARSGGAELRSPVSAARVSRRAARAAGSLCPG